MQPTLNPYYDHNIFLETIKAINYFQYDPAHCCCILLFIYPHCILIIFFFYVYAMHGLENNNSLFLLMLSMLIPKTIL